MAATPTPQATITLAAAPATKGWIRIFWFLACSNDDGAHDTRRRVNLLFPFLLVFLSGIGDENGQ